MCSTKSIAIPALLSLTVLVGCGEALTVTEADRKECDAVVTKLTGRAAVGEQVARTVHNRNGVKSIRLIYPETKDFPGVQCDMVAGEVKLVVKFNTIFPTSQKSS